MRLAVIDCGTNTFNLLIMDVVNGGDRKKVFSARFPVKLGEGFINEGYIGQPAFNRALEAIASFDRSMREHQVNIVLAFATSAVRDASNGAELVNHVKQQYSINIDVIDGYREAELIYLGIRDAVKLNRDTSLIMDIGGGSTEFILANQDGILWKHSFNIGAARLLQKFSPSNPLSGSERTVLTDYLEKELQPLFKAIEIHPAAEIIGSSGAFESLVEMIHGEMDGEALTANKTEYEIDLSKNKLISERVIASTLEERKNIKGLVAMRLDMIVISCLMVDFVLSKLRLQRMRVSTYSLKEGALADFIDKRLS